VSADPTAPLVVTASPAVGPGWRRQPLVGVVATALVIVVSLLVIAAMDWPLFRDWVSYYLMCTIPFAFVVGAFWHGQHPASIAGLRQPWRGLGYLVLALAVGAVVSVLAAATVGGGLTPPPPNAVQLIIMSVPISFWLTVIMGGWPFSKVRSRLLGGLLVLVATYLIDALVYRLVVNYDFLRGTPAYVASLDPGGPLGVWAVLVFIVTCMAAGLLLLQLGLWPLSRWSGVGRQPLGGLVVTAVMMAISGLVLWLGLHVLGLAEPVLLTSVTVPFLFGSIVVLIMLEGSAYPRLRQPVRGLVTIVTAIVVGQVLAALFLALSGPLPGDVVSGPPTFEKQLWLASALLAVTFPFLSFYLDFFALWPLRRPSTEVDG
jgi:hypothetical protein